MIIAITGSRGYLGSRIVEYAKEHTIRHLDRPLYVVGEKLPDAWLKDVDLLIHCAWDGNHKKNVSGTAKLVEQAKKNEVKKIVIISSNSAGAQSKYGQAKLAVEKEANGCIIVRPGLLYDNRPGGLLGKIVSIAKFSPVVPLLKDAKQYTTHTEDLYNFILKAKPGLHYACARQYVPLKKIIKRYTGPRLFVELPYGFLEFFLKYTSWYDNLKGLAHTPKPQFEKGFRRF